MGALVQHQGRSSQRFDEGGCRRVGPQLSDLAANQFVNTTRQVAPPSALGDEQGQIADETQRSLLVDLMADTEGPLAQLVEAAKAGAESEAEQDRSRSNQHDPGA